MYFKDIELFDMKRYVSNPENIYAHTKGKNKEKLKEHMDLTYEYFLKLCKEKNFNNIFENFQKTFLENEVEETIQLWKELLCNTIYMHDIGKINGDFQNRKMGNERYRNIPQIDSNHSMLSVCIYLDYYFRKFKNINGEEAKSLLLVFLLLNSYVISKHHGSLDDFSLFKERLEISYKFFLENRILYEDYRENFRIKPNNIKVYFDVFNSKIDSFDDGESWKCIDIYIYTRILSSPLVASDFYATSHYETGNRIDGFGTIEDIEKFYSVFRNGEIYSNIQKYKNYLEGKESSPFKENDINVLRSEMFLEAEKNLEKNYKENIFYLEAPTGAGKTNTSINLAFKLLEREKNLNKIFYIFPFNTLVEQTKRSLDEIFKEDENIMREIAVVNSITPIIVEEDDEDNESIIEKKTGRKIDYERAVLNRQFLHYPIVLLTHVGFFNHLFGVSREEVFTLAHMANSVIILDEIQSYKNNIWKEIIIFLKKYAKLLNIKIIIMSATLPRLEQLADSKESFVQLIENRNKYFENPLFRDRVNLDFSLLDVEGNTWDILKEAVISSAKEIEGNILIEFIKKGSAMEFYKELLQINVDKNLKKKILLITGDDNKVERNRIIKSLKNEKNIILVATQVIEAGVDIDMDMGFKDISILDAEEQFLGRINRSCKKRGSKVFFFNLDDASGVYNGDYRKDKSISLIEESIRNILKAKDFQSFYSIVMNRIESDLNRENSSNITKFREGYVRKLNYIQIQKRMKLIDDDRKEYTIFLNREIEMENGEVLVGSMVWEAYYNILVNSKMDYAEKKVKLSRVIEKMDYFIYKVNLIQVSYNDVIGDIFYIEDGEKYFIEGKFDRECFNSGKSYEIL